MRLLSPLAAACLLALAAAPPLAAGASLVSRGRIEGAS